MFCGLAHFRGPNEDFSSRVWDELFGSELLSVQFSDTVSLISSDTVCSVDLLVASLFVLSVWPLQQAAFVASLPIFLWSLESDDEVPAVGSSEELAG